MGLFNKKKKEKKEGEEGEQEEFKAELGLSEDQKEWLEEAFLLYAVNGKIDLEGMLQLFYTFGGNPSDEDVKAIKADLGAGTLQDALRLLSNDKFFKKETEEDVRNFLDTFDRERNGTIDVNFLKHVMSIMPNALPQKDLDLLFSKLKAGRDGFMNIDDISTVLIDNHFMNNIANTYQYH